MSESPRCPDCGNPLPAHAPGGPCPRCAQGAAGAATAPAWGVGPAHAVEDRDTLFGSSSAGTEIGPPSAPVDLDRFKRSVLELGLISGGEFERFMAGALGGVPGLARALVVAGKLTPYQAGALEQGKARGLVIGNYFILDKLGQGGMGVVFKARHRRLGRVVALKILPPSLARNPDLLTRFRREVDVAAKLSHPNVVSVLDADEDRGIHFMTMEYIKGNDLDRLVRDGGVLPVGLALDCAIQAARGLEAAHAQGIVHRDIKPGNLMLDESGVVRVLDLGLARLVEAANPFGETTPGPLTQSGTYMGTVDYMAPEQGVDSRRVDHRADIYSLGCTLCYLLTGRAPFDGANVLARLMAHQERPPASLLALRPDVPGAVEAVYQAMMAKRPGDRPASMTEVIARLEACRSSPVEAGSARTELMSFAETVALKRAAPKGTTRDLSVVPRDEPKAVQPRAIARRDDAPLERRDKPRPAAPKGVPAPARPRRRSRTRRFALTAVALLALGGLGYAFLPRDVLERLRPWPSRIGPGDFPAGSVWVNAAKKLRLKVVERDATTFKAEFATAGSLREVRGTIRDDRFAWLAEDVRAVHGTRGDDNQGTIQGNTIDLTWNGRTPGSVTLYRERPANESPGAPATASTFGVATCYSTNDQHQNWHALAVTGDGRRAFVGGRTQYPVLLDVDLGHPILLKTPFPWAGATISDMAVTPDGRRGAFGTFASGRNNHAATVDRGILEFFDLTTGKPLFPKKQPYEGDIRAVTIAADGLRALSAGVNGELTLWDLNTGQTLRQFGPHKEGVSFHCVAFFPDGRRAASGGHDHLVRVWDLDTGAELAAWPGHEKTISGLAISADGRRLATGGYDGAVILRDADRGKILHQFTMPKADKGARVAFDHEGNLVAAGNGAGGPNGIMGRLVVWDSETYRVIREDEMTFARHSQVAALPHGRVLTIDPHGVRLWTPRSPAPSPPASQASLDKKPVDLIRRVQATTFRSGTWQVDNGVLLSPTDIGRLQFPTVPPPEYRLDLEVERVGKDSAYAFGLGILVDGHQTSLGVDAKNAEGQKVTGLNGYDGISVFQSLNVHRGPLLVPSKPSRFVVTVRRDAVAVTCDGAPVMDWKGDPRRFIPIVGWNVPDPDKLFLVTSGAVKFHKITMTALSAGGH